MDTFVDKNGKPVLIVDDKGEVILDKLKKKKESEEEDEATEG